VAGNSWQARPNLAASPPLHHARDTYTKHLVLPVPRGLHSSTYQLNGSTFCGIRSIKWGIQVVCRAC